MLNEIFNFYIKLELYSKFLFNIYNIFKIKIMFKHEFFELSYSQKSGVTEF